MNLDIVLFLKILRMLMKISIWYLLIAFLRRLLTGVKFDNNIVNKTSRCSKGFDISFANSAKRNYFGSKQTSV